MNNNLFRPQSVDEICMRAYRDIREIYSFNLNAMNI